MWFVIVMLLFLGWGLSTLFASKETDFEELKKDGDIEPLDYVQTNYYGGFRDVSAKENPFINIYMFEDKVRVIFNLYLKMIDYKDIPREDIISVRYMNETELRDSISVGKVLVFGWVGLAMKNQKEVNKEYIILTCKYEDKVIDVALNSTYGSNNSVCFEKINNYIMDGKIRA